MEDGHDELDRLLSSLPSDPSVQFRMAMGLAERVYSNAVAVSQSRIEALQRRCSQQRGEIDRLRKHSQHLEQENRRLKTGNNRFNCALQHFRDKILPEVYTPDDTIEGVVKTADAHSASELIANGGAGKILQEIDRATMSSHVNRSDLPTNTKSSVHNVFDELQAVIPPNQFTEIAAKIKDFQSFGRPDQTLMDDIRSILADKPVLCRRVLDIVSSKPAIKKAFRKDNLDLHNLG